VSLLQVAQAREQYQDELLDLQEKEALESEKQAREEAVAREEAELKVYYICIEIISL
jgi:hypothetical protein